MKFTAPDSELTSDIIKCAIEVHRTIGPGLKEEVYERALQWELKQLGHEPDTQVEVPIVYKGQVLTPKGDSKRADMVVNKRVVVELKAVSRMEPVFKAQCLTYAKMFGYKTGLVLNFGLPTLREGLQHVINESKEEYRSRLLTENPNAFRAILVEENGVSLEEAFRMQQGGDLGL